MKRKRINRKSRDVKTVASKLASLYNVDFKTAMRAYASQNYSINDAKSVLSLTNLKSF